jgi:hypothetical protein
MDKRITSWVIIGGIFFLANSLLFRCGEEPEDISADRQSNYSGGGNIMAQRQNGVMTEVQEIGPDDFRIVKEYPSKVTGVILSKLDGFKEVVPEEKLPALMEQAKQEKGFGLGTVLSAGLLGYMMGHNSSLSPYAYKDEKLYKQSMVNRDLVNRQLEEEDKRRGYSGYWSGGRYYSSHPYTGTAARSSSTKSGFFSRLGSSLRGLG